MIHRYIKSDMLQMKIIHREDIKNMDEKWERLFSLFVQNKIEKIYSNIL